MYPIFTDRINSVSVTDYIPGSLLTPVNWLTEVSGDLITCYSEGVCLALSLEERLLFLFLEKKN